MLTDELRYKLYEYYTTGEQELIKKILETGDVNCRDSLGWTLLIRNCCMYNNIEMVNLLIECGADVNIQDNDGDTALHLAVEHYADEKIINLLLKHGANPKIKNKKGLKPKDLAEKRSYKELIKNAENIRKEYLNNRVIKIPILIQDINDRDSRGKTMLNKSAEDGNIKRVKELIISGDDLNMQDTDGQTVLMNAVYQNNCDVVKILLENGADPNLQDTNGRTALMNAVYQNNCDVVKILLENGADPNLQDKEGYTALHFLSLSKAQIEICKLLIQYGSNIDIKNHRNLTPIRRLEDHLYSDNFGYKESKEVFEEYKKLFESVVEIRQEFLKKQQESSSIEELKTQIIKIIEALNKEEQNKIKAILNNLVIKYKEEKENIQPKLQEEYTPTLSLGMTENTLKNNLMNELQRIINTLNVEESLIYILNQVKGFKNLANSQIEVPSRTDDITGKILYIIGISQKYQKEEITGELIKELNEAEEKVSKKVSESIITRTPVTTLEIKNIENELNVEITKLYENVYKYHTCVTMVKESEGLKLVKENILKINEEKRVKIQEGIKELEEIVNYEKCKEIKIGELIEKVKVKIKKILTEFKEIGPRSIVYNEIIKDIEEGLGIYDTEKKGAVESKVEDIEKILEKGVSEEIESQIRKDIEEVLNKWKEKLKRGEKVEIENKERTELKTEKIKIEYEIIEELTEIEIRLRQYISENERITRGI